MAEDVLRFADACQISRFGLVGHSMGGKVAMTLAMLQSRRLDGLVIIDSPPKDVTHDLVYVPTMKAAVAPCRSV